MDATLLSKYVQLHLHLLVWHKYIQNTRFHASWVQISLYTYTISYSTVSFYEGKVCNALQSTDTGITATLKLQALKHFGKKEIASPAKLIFNRMQWLEG